MKLNLRALRVNKNLTQEEAASKLGISLDTLWRYENGKAYPKVPMIQKLEQLYECRYEDIDFRCDCQKKEENWYVFIKSIIQ